MFIYHISLLIISIICVFSQESQNSHNSLIIIGSGLAGHSAAAQAVLINPNIDILIFEKEAKYGGNSFKATSGINGAGTIFQSDSSISDNSDDFLNDVMFSFHGGKNDDYINPLVKILVDSSGSAVNWLKNVFNLNLTKITQCGGHSAPRTHRPPSGPAGLQIVKAVHEFVAKQPNIKFCYNCTVIELLFDDESKRVFGVKYTKDNKIHLSHSNSVILTTGGYANDHTSDSLLDKYSLDNENKLATTNGKWATGDGVKMGSKIGGKLIDMSYIQVHPTGFINPKDKDSLTKFLAPEALRGSGGILVNNLGNRFVNELDLRSNIVSKEKEQQSLNNLPLRLLMNEECVNNFGKNFNFYWKRIGLFTKYNNLKELSDDININYNNLKNTFNNYGKNLDENKKDEFGKSVFPVKVFDINDSIYSALITPVIHYTMGGLQIDNYGRILDLNEDSIHGLFGAGEVTGGVHGKNRLAGNSLLECVVYGRIAAKSALDYINEITEQTKQEL